MTRIAVVGAAGRMGAEVCRAVQDAEGLELESYRAMRLHLIHAERDVEELSASSKLNADWDFLTYLHARGRAWANDWLDKHFDAIGKHATFDLNELFQDAIRPVLPHGEATAETTERQNR